MAACFYCGAETDLYQSGQAICIQCADLLELGIRPPRREKRQIDPTIYAALKKELQSAKQRHDAARVRFREASERGLKLTRYTAGVPESDSHQMLRNALREENEARNAQLGALMRLNNYLQNGSVPEHLNGNTKSTS